MRGLAIAPALYHPAGASARRARKMLGLLTALSKIRSAEGVVGLLLLALMIPVIYVLFYKGKSDL
jgi:hypothetical protein